MSYVYQSMSADDIANRLLADQYASWSRLGAYAIAEYLLQKAEDTDEPIQFDLVAIRCDFSEYKSFEDAATEYGTPPESIAMNSFYIEFDGGIILANY